MDSWTNDSAMKAYPVVPGDPSTASFGGFVVGPMHAAVRAAAAGFRPYFMHGGGLCGGNQLHASGTWDNGISLLQRPQLRFQAARGGRALRRSTGPCHRTLARRKVADPGP